MINRYDAPEGHVAIRRTALCESCAFFLGFCSELKCSSDKRPDQTDVIFVTRSAFEKMLIKEIREFYQAEEIALSRTNENIVIHMQ